MTRQEAKDSISRIGKVLGVMLAALALLGAAKTGMEWWLVPQRQAKAVADSLNAYFLRQQLADIRWKVEDSVFKSEMRHWKYQDCVRRNRTSKACIQPKQ